MRLSSLPLIEGGVGRRGRACVWRGRARPAHACLYRAAFRACVVCGADTLALPFFACSPSPALICPRRAFLLGPQRACRYCPLQLSLLRDGRHCEQWEQSSLPWSGGHTSPRAPPPRPSRVTCAVPPPRRRLSMGRRRAMARLSRTVAQRPFFPLRLACLLPPHPLLSLLFNN